MVKVKICGITNLDDARAAIAAGADFLGFNFYPPSPRFIEPKNARSIIDELKNESVTTVGVFVNEPSAEALIEIVDTAGVEAIQLHGDETADFCRALETLAANRLIIKVLRARDQSVIKAAVEYDKEAIMLDAFDPKLRGGTGRQVDLDLARCAAEVVPQLFLAGGLSPENVAHAIKTVRPYAVDACSSVELLPGKKDAGRMRAFVEAARNS